LSFNPEKTKKPRQKKKKRRKKKKKKKNQNASKTSGLKPKPGRTKGKSEFSGKKKKEEKRACKGKSDRTKFFTISRPVPKCVGATRGFGGQKKRCQKKDGYKSVCPVGGPRRVEKNTGVDGEGNDKKGPFVGGEREEPWGKGKTSTSGTMVSDRTDDYPKKGSQIRDQPTRTHPVC